MWLSDKLRTAARQPGLKNPVLLQNAAQVVEAAEVLAMDYPANDPDSDPNLGELVHRVRSFNEEESS